MSLQQEANKDGLRLLERLGKNESGASENADDFGNAHYKTLDPNDSYFRDDNSKITHSLQEKKLEEQMKRPKKTPLRHDKTFPLDRQEARKQRVFGGHFNPHKYKQEMEEHNKTAPVLWTTVCKAPCSPEATIDDEEEGENLNDTPYPFPAASVPSGSGGCPSKVTINISACHETSINLLNDSSDYTPPSFTMIGDDGRNIPMSFCPPGASTPQSSFADSTLKSCHDSSMYQSAGSSLSRSSNYQTASEHSSCPGFDSSMFQTQVSPGRSMSPTPPPAMNVSMSLSPCATHLTVEALSDLDSSQDMSSSMSLQNELLNMTQTIDMNETFTLQEEIRGYQKKRRQYVEEAGKFAVMRTKRKNKKTQQVVIPKGMLLPWEAAVIEIPRRYLKDPVVIVKRRPGEVAQYRAASHFVSSGPPGVQNLRVIRGSKGGYDNDSDEEDYQGTSSQPASNASSPQNSYYQIPQQQFAPSYLPPPQFQQAPPPQFQQAPPPQFQQAPPPQFQQAPPLQSYHPQLYQQNYFPRQLPQTFSPPMMQSQLQRQGTMPKTNFKCVVCPSKLSESSGKYCVPPDAIDMQAELDLSEKERMEREKLTRSLEEFQRSRRTFLGSSKAFSAKISNISNISCDSSCSKLDF